MIFYQVQVQVLCFFKLYSLSVTYNTKSGVFHRRIYLRLIFVKMSYYLNQNLKLKHLLLNNLLPPNSLD